MTTVNNRKVSPPLGKGEDLREKGFFNRPRAGGKSIWDWMQLLIIPFVLAVGGLLLSTYQHNTDQYRALDQQQATILQTYIDNIQDLMLNHNLLRAKPSDDVAVLARARTLAALQGLDPERKGLLLKFIYDAGLIGTIQSLSLKSLGTPTPTPTPTLFPTKPVNPVFLLSDADLSHADLHDANLSGANLSDANLSGANLGGAVLSSADLSQANLTNANPNDAELIDVNLSDVDLSYADLTNAVLNSANFAGADLSQANLSGAELLSTDFSSAKNLMQQQLDQGSSCTDALLPKGLTCHHNWS